MQLDDEELDAIARKVVPIVMSLVRKETEVQRSGTFKDLCARYGYGKNSSALHKLINSDPRFPKFTSKKGEIRRWSFEQTDEYFNRRLEDESRSALDAVFA